MECQNGFRTGRSGINPLFSIKLLIEKRREFNFETHLTFLDCVKSLDKVKRDECVEIIRSNNILNLLLRSIVEIYSGNKMKVKIVSY